jgi:hypothetical protein
MPTQNNEAFVVAQFIGENRLNALVGGSAGIVDLGMVEFPVIQVPYGAVDTSQGDFVTLTVTTHPNVEGVSWTEGSGDTLYEIKLSQDLRAGKSVLVTIPFDLWTVEPNRLFDGTYSVWKAPTLDDLLNGNNLTEIPVNQVAHVDDLGNRTAYGLVSVETGLSVYGVGLASAKGGLADTSDDSCCCFIATAAYDSPIHRHVKILKDFRDAYLLPGRLGSAFVDAYYRFAPPVAQFIDDHDGLKPLVRIALLPAVGTSYAILHLGFTGCLLVFAGLLCLALVMVRVRRSRV